MKRRITIRQLNELSEEQKVRLREWWKPEHGDLVYDTDLKNVQCIYPYDIYLRGFFEEVLPLLDIGQMIELLQEHGVKEDGIELLSCLTFCKPVCRQDEFIYNDTIIGLYWAGRFDGVELVDALWQAVKSVL